MLSIFLNKHSSLSRQSIWQVLMNILSCIFKIVLFLFIKAAKQPPSATVSIFEQKIGAPWAPQMVLKLPQGHEDSKYVLSFEIGQREGGFYSAQTDGQNHRQTHPVAY